MLKQPQIKVSVGDTIILREESVYPEIEVEVISIRPDGGLMVKEVFNNGQYGEPMFAWAADIVKVVAHVVDKQNAR